MTVHYCPDYKMTEISSTPVRTLIRARNIAHMAGLKYVYTGNMHNEEGEITFCPSCSVPLIERDWYEIAQYRLTSHGHCPDCDTAIVGRFGEYAETFGRRRIPVTIGG